MNPANLPGLGAVVSFIGPFTYFGPYDARHVATETHARWITDGINILLTAAIAWAGYRQYVVANRLLKLQNAIEEQRNKVWLFLRIKQSAHAGRNTAMLEITNLSLTGIWLEKVSVHLVTEKSAPNKAHGVMVEKQLRSSEAAGVDISATVRLLAGIMHGERKPVTAWVAVEFWANGAWHVESTNHYSMDVEYVHVSNIKSTT